MKQILTWTALPNGIDTATLGTTPVLKLSVRVSPRLTPIADGLPISNFGDFGNWTGKPWSFAVLFGNAIIGATTPPTVSGLKPTNSLDPELWTKLFQGPPPVTVRTRPEYKYTNPVVRSFPAARIHDFIKKQYSDTALHFPSDLPPAGWFTERIGASLTSPESPELSLGYTRRQPFVAIHPEDRSQLAKTIHGMIRNGVVPPEYGTIASAGSDLAAQLDFYQAEFFHAPKGSDYLKKPVVPDLDFHQVLTLLGDYPKIMRALGLVFDLEVPIPPHLADIKANLVRVWPENPLVGAENPIAESYTALATRYDYDAGKKVFAAQPNGSLIKNGHLDLGGDDFLLAQVDIDGAAMKAINFSKTIYETGLFTKDVIGTPEGAGLPALRSGGLSVLKKDRASELVQKLKHGGDLESQLVNAPNEITFSAEGLARGYRIDIFDENQGMWYSLCQRIGRYSHASDASGIYIFPEEIQDEGTVTVPAISSSAPNASKDHLFLHEALFHWDGWSLVVGHPGKTIKTPVVNAADNVGYEPTNLANAIGLQAQFKVAPNTLPRLRYGRYYRLRARIVDIAGNSRELAADLDTTGATARIPYLRFEPVPPPALVSEEEYRPGESAERLVIRSWDAHATTPTDEIAKRYLLAPRTTIQMAEQHGAIDGPAPDGGKSWYAELAGTGTKPGRDAAQIPEYRKPPPPPLPLPDDYVPPPPFNPAEPVPYLPDPIAAGVAITGLPGADAPACLRIDFRDTEAWPIALNIQLAIVEGDAGSIYDATTRALTLSLPKAESATLRLSSFLPDEKALYSLGIWDWIEEAAPEAWHEKLKKICREGRHWMISPFRELKVVHAVQRPLAAPFMKEHFPVRLIGDNFYTLKGLLQIHAKSTDKVDFHAEWNEIIPQAGHLDGFVLAPRSAEAMSIKIDNQAFDFALVNHTHELGDTKHRRIAYRATATSRFREYFEHDDDQDIPKDLTFTTPADNKRPADFTLDIPSSARPSAPNIEYIIPTFGWEESRNDDGTFRRRTGNSLRVYMSDDWFSSGEGELLGVVLAHGPRISSANGLSAAEVQSIDKFAAPIPPDGLQRYITRWGIDPIWQGGITHQLPTMHEFPAAVARGADLILAENPSIPADEPTWAISVAGHPVAYDSERQLWYCDIPMDAGPAYYPFVRLALARYQPCSVKNCELSRVTTNDCVQIAPDRLVTVSDNPDAPRKVRISVSGLAPQKSEKIRCPNRVIARAEVCMPGAETCTWVPVAGPWLPLSEIQMTKGTIIWTGELMLPQTRDAQRYRIIVEEYEFLTADPGRGLGAAIFTGLEDITRAPENLWPRLVYSDAIELDPPLAK